jgi:uncharacterized protein YndB with AHSA1/START domain
MVTQNSEATATSEQEIVITRVLDAPRELVWKAWTEPDRLMRWWGPNGYSSPAAKIDLRVGGDYLYCMRTPEGNDTWSGGTFREIVPMARIVATDHFADEQGNRIPASTYGLEGDWPDDLLVTVTFEDLGGKTKLTLRHAGFPAGDMPGMATEGWNQSLDKLAESLADADREIVISRVFDAPRDVVFSAWTDPAHVAQWWGPNGFSTTIHEMEVRPGGAWRFIMHGPDGVDYKNRIVFREVTPPGRLVYAHDDDGEGASAEFLTTVTFVDVGGKTEVTMRSRFASKAERDRVVEEFGAIEGGKQTLARLAEYLSQIQRASSSHERKRP